ncbi:carbohydrate ABC transporter membrane protein 1 (CUT1 family) [Melghirimyces profundicolus]|uniref:Carbohydrate ABC transporter membrane protein 1 (CUT1 family) n=1 Tax=Melghirimyces profundicolus TaxID=1242148 RepID=A0A2T6BZ23_9BACL|nr:sugar ABC transporter permease [Melghirimyces profundicolus]PTX61324.1 carbohydrate ABC transporter membrane protein 1 (CUT1 family) [Melghirimyces profundicolus]
MPQTQQRYTSQHQLAFSERVKTGLKQWVEVFPFLILGLIGTGVFVIYPLMKGIVMSFQDYSVIPGAENPFVGLANYKKAFSDPAFGYAVRNTILNTVVTVPINWFLGLFFAVLINLQFVKFKITFRTVYYLPIVTSWIVVAFLFKYLFAGGEGGVVNYGLMNLGIIDRPIGWLQNQWTAMVVIWLFHIWKTVGWVLVVYLAALQGIPRHLYEAAAIDGANGIQQFRNVIIPTIKPVTLFVVIQLIMGAFNIFPQVYFLTNGGPMGQTEVLQSMIYKEAFNNFNFGYSSALSVMMGLTIFIVTWSQQKQFGKQRFL